MMSLKRRFKGPGRRVLICLFCSTTLIALVMFTSQERYYRRKMKGFANENAPLNTYDMSKHANNSVIVGDINKWTSQTRRKITNVNYLTDVLNTSSNGVDNITVSRATIGVNRTRVEPHAKDMDGYQPTLSNRQTDGFPGRADFTLNGFMEELSYELHNTEAEYRNETDRSEGRLRKIRQSSPNRHHNISDSCVRIGVFARPNNGRWNGSYECPGTGCTVEVFQTPHPRFLGEARAVFIPHSSLHLVDFQELNRFRSPHQLWVFNSFESPVHTTPLINNWARFGFNWTFTYRTDSTFPSPYGRYIPGKPLIAENDTTNWAHGKTEFAAWIGSNCHNTGWPRLEFVHRLKNHIPLDTFGACGTKTCPKNPRCGETLIKYKFYFALENSNCQDYITEKFWTAPIKNNIIPVVYGPPREDYEKVAPPKSFIHVDDFRTMSELADYLKLLDSDDSLFNQYFEWKKKGSVETDLIVEYYHSRKVMCRIASKITERRLGGKTKPETLDMKTWWTDSCKAKKPKMM